MGSLSYAFSEISEEKRKRRGNGLKIYCSSKKITLREREEPSFSRTQCQVNDETKMGQIMEDIENENEELEVKNCPKNKNNIEKPKIVGECPSCKQ